jgi:hypothetical protein
MLKARQSMLSKLPVTPKWLHGEFWGWNGDIIIFAEI